MHSAVRRTVLGAASTTALVVLLLALKPHHAAVPTAQGARAGSAPQATAPAAPHSTASPGGPATRGGTASPGRTASPRGTAGPSGTYTGTPVTVRYGVVQVRATLHDGRLTAVTVLQAPSDNGRDQQIAADSLPVLTQEALTAQSAHIDAVSGASYTSEGYIQSLQSALDQAHA